MRDTKKFDRKHFDQFRTTPLKLIPFSPVQKKIAQRWVKKLKKHFDSREIFVFHRGSTLFEISGKGDIDVSIHANGKNYDLAKRELTDLFGEPRAYDNKFAAFYLNESGYEVEFSLVKGHEAKVDLLLTQTLLDRPDLVQEYENLKKKYCYSKREYLYQRSKFFKRILKSL